MPGMKIREGDLVQVLSGKDRGKQGHVIKAQPGEGRVLVENLNIVKRHTRPRPIKDSSRMGGQQVAPGGVIEKPAPIDISNVMFVCPVCNRATRVGFKIREVKGEKVKVRFCRRADCGQEIPERERK
jgi:large subunit ribosomal protein L24